jgi:hypothetical protein
MKGRPMTRGAHEAFVEYRAAAAPGDRKFGLTVGGICLGLCGLRWALGHGGPATMLLSACGAALILFGLLAPTALGPLNKAWMRLGLVMAAIINPLIMLLMFLLVFTPAAVAMRLKGRDALLLRRKPEDATYWHERGQLEPPASRLGRQF